MGYEIKRGGAIEYAKTKSDVLRETLSQMEVGDSVDIGGTMSITAVYKVKKDYETANAYDSSKAAKFTVKQTGSGLVIWRKS